jgi:hypothetical protein
MTAIHRREMFGVLLGGAVVATVGSTLIAGPAESAAMSENLKFFRFHQEGATDDPLTNETPAGGSS